MSALAVNDPSELANVRPVDVPVRALSRLEPLIGSDRYLELLDAAARARRELGGRIIWNLNSTSSGGGVAEMLQVLVGYTLDAGIDIRWLVMSGDPGFFAVTKRIHNRLHGAAADAGSLGPVEAAHYGDVTAANARSVAESVRPGDVVLLHDPQTAGMASVLAEAGAHVVWRCHVGSEHPNESSDEAWSFLRPHLSACEGFVFSVSEYVPDWMESSRVRVIPPSIDPFSPKNQEMAPHDVVAIMCRIGLLAGDREAADSFTRSDGSIGRVGRAASIMSVDAAGVAPDTPLVVQVSRWDRLKDMAGVMAGFAEEVAGRADAHLALVGPSTAGVTDDPEGAEVFEECAAQWEALSPLQRSWVSLVSLPMDDIDENAAMVNAIQRHASVIVQKSLAEGFGLTVAEGMWKAKPVIASRVGGIPSQVEPGTGILVDDPRDLRAFGETLCGLLLEPAEMIQLGGRARQHVLGAFVGDRHLMQYGELMEWLVCR